MIYEWVRVIDPGRITVGSQVIVDDFVFIDGGQSLTIGSHLHIASHAGGPPPPGPVDELERRLLAAEDGRA